MLGSAIWIAPAVFATISHIAQRRLGGEPWPPLHELLFSGGDWLIYGFLAPLIFWVVDRWPIVRPHIGRRMGVHFLFALLTCVLWATGGKVLQFLLVNTLNSAEAQRMRAEIGDQIWQRLGLDLVGWIFVTLPFGVIVYICVAGIAHAVRYFLEAREREVQLARLSEQLAGARFSALQAQLNPHFLFNTLNTIAVRARDGDGAGTARMVEQLSDVLRRTLTRHRANEVALQDELELVEQYLAIEQARFSDRLRPSFDVDPAAGPRRCRASRCSISSRMPSGTASRARRRGPDPRHGAARRRHARAHGRGRRGRLRASEAAGPRHREHAGAAARALWLARVAHVRQARRRRHGRHAARAVARDRAGGRRCRALSGRS